MLRYVIFAMASLLLASCWSDSSKSTVIPCTYKEPTQVPEYQWSTLPDQMHITVDQERLTKFMAIALSDDECYLRNEDHAVLAKMVSGREPNPEFAEFKEASNVMTQSWRDYSAAFQNGLMGLTTIQYGMDGSHRETIREIDLMVRDDARRWHLWHEYTHVLIGEARATSETQTLSLPGEKVLEDQTAQLKTLDPGTDEYTTRLAALVQGFRDRIDKAYIDELLIEATLVDLTIQHRHELGLTSEDYLRTVNAMNFFMGRYEDYSREVRDVLQDLLDQNDDHVENKMTLSRAILYFGDQHRDITQVVLDASQQAQAQLFNEN